MRNCDLCWLFAGVPHVTRSRLPVLAHLLALFTSFLLTTRCRAELEPVRIAPGGRSFELSNSGAAFVPWGFNYAPGEKLLEDVWESDWPTILEDFREMKDLGANVVRIHLQVAAFMDGPEETNRKSLERLGKLIRLAEELGLYLDITGLACYRPTDTPKWYDQLPQHERWRAQQQFWSSIATLGAESHAIFCYDLINEPVVAAQERNSGEWRSGNLFGNYDFVQYISINKPARERHEIAIEWIKTQNEAIRQHDQRHLITVGLLPSTKAWGHFSGFVPERIAPELDFMAVHIYPEAGELEEADEVVKQFAVGKPLVVEETFNLRCSPDDLRKFLLGSRTSACGWIGHYDGQSIADLEKSTAKGENAIRRAIWLEWLRLFRSLRPEMNIDRRPTSK
ncbi:MAG: cellulase family glycosylhydrolase [Pirellulales bacterium]|nr:cellulase family glycosylhydrolase [Pirellulales bacterium]